MLIICPNIPNKRPNFINQNFMRKNINWFQLFQILTILLAVIGLESNAQVKYKGKAFKDSIQHIPGKIQCEFYDQGGEGIAYHDTDTINSGSGRLNPADGTFLNEFRINEGVDISYTKFRDPAIDNNPYNVVEPNKNQLYVGWTEPGEWIKYTVSVKVSGTYSIGLMYTASGDGGISLYMDEKQITPELKVPSTRNDKEPVAWRQWHHWNRIENLTLVSLKKGIHVLTLKTVSNGNMNYDYLDFRLVK
jgi:Carbohydrate binding module (family 6)